MIGALKGTADGDGAARDAHLALVAADLAETEASWRLECAKGALADLAAEWVDLGCVGGSAPHDSREGVLVQAMIDARREWTAASVAFLVACAATERATVRR